MFAVPPAHSQATLPVNNGPTSAPTPRQSALAKGDVVVRPVSSLADFHACVDLQREIWGPEWSDTVPASMLQVASYVGGIVLGAFDLKGELVGFLFGLTGVVRGEQVHWSHMLGVRDSARNAGVGRLMKDAQRSELSRRGIKRMSWTFDPLVAKNAHFNLNRLGAQVVEYVPDMYGTTSSPLHYGLATDRLVVSLGTNAELQSDGDLEAHADAPVLGTDVAPQSLAARYDLPPSVRIEIPSDIRLVIEQSPAMAAEWRESVRANFQWALAHSYNVRGLYREPVTSRSFYTLVRDVA
jgi:predicted GNAT superfamily acetyltransferase